MSTWLLRPLPGLYLVTDHMLGHAERESRTWAQAENARSPSPWINSGTYDFSSCFFPKFKVMHFQNGDIKLYTVVLLFLCFLKILTKLCCRWSWSRRSTVNNRRVREFQIPDRRAQ